jgi:hypothetical protein
MIENAKPLAPTTAALAAALADAAALDANEALCNERCIDAVCEQCTCSCGGLNHGVRREVTARVSYQRRLASVGGDPFALLPTPADDDIF